MSTIVWRREDDSVAITYCAPGVDPEQHRDELIARAKADKEAAERGEIHVPDGHELANADYLVHEPVAIAAAIPQDSTREFRNAMVWDPAGKKVVHHMGRARELRRDRLRALRAPVLDALDRDYNKAVGMKNDAEAAAVEKKRQALRDITKHSAIDKAATLDELRAVVLP